jgi:hypothetical protein
MSLISGCIYPLRLIPIAVDEWEYIPASEIEVIVPLSCVRALEPIHYYPRISSEYICGF